MSKDLNGLTEKLGKKLEPSEEQIKALYDFYVNVSTINFRKGHGVLCFGVDYEEYHSEILKNVNNVEKVLFPKGHIGSNDI